MSIVATVRFTKGQGTENDFVIVPDLDGTLVLDDAMVRFLCDRRAGIGGDGAIRVVPTQCSDEPEVLAQAGAAPWFMDYRNADGSRAEMCGNGARVFAAYLRREGLESRDSFSIATRAGVKDVRIEGDAIAVDLGPWRLADPKQASERGYDALVTPRGGRAIPGLSLDLGNPHTVVALPPGVVLERLDLGVSPHIAPTPLHGSNVEFVHPIGHGHIAMRVYERGVGETRSCGTGAAAAALATRWWEGESTSNREWTVDVPGGRLRVRALDGQRVELAGPAELVADGTVTLA